MSKLVFLCVLLLLSTNVRGDGCALPAASSGEPYLTLAGLSKRQFYLLLNEYMFVHSWAQHAEAKAAGFRPGSRVYGEVLREGGRFDPKTEAAWRRAYTKSGHAQFQTELGRKVEMASVDRAVVDWVLAVCLGSGLWSEVRVINDCRFVFTAGLVRDASPATVRPFRLEVRGGRCREWPGHPLSVKGDAVQCVRSGREGVTVELVTGQAGATRQTLSPLREPELPPEPVQENKLSTPTSEVFRLWRSRDYRLQQLGKGCPTCALYVAEIRPTAADAVILRAETVSSSGAGWQRCPAGLRCGVYEFSPPDNPQLSGCADRSACRVWRLAETSGEAGDVIQLTYRISELSCVNCPSNMDFETAHKRWEATRDAVPGLCQVFPDSPAQSIAPAGKD